MKKRNFTIVSILTFFIALVLAAPLPALAGSLDSSAAPTDAGSAMYTLEGIYNRLNAGTTGSKRSGAFTEPSSGPTSGTGYTLDDVMGKAPTVDATNGLTPSETTSGKTFWGLNSGTWGLQTGSNANVVDTTTGDAVAGEILSGKVAYVDGSSITGSLATQTLSAASTTVSTGNYAATTLTAVDSDLATGNIKSGVTIFGVAGDSNVVDTTTGDAVATEIANGKKAWVDGSEITGSLYAGVTCDTGGSATLNGTRWCDNGDGTVTDLNTGLIWLQAADWGGTVAFWVGTQGGTNAHDRAASLTDAGNGALSDGSVEGDWRLPTLKELKALTASGTEDVFSGTTRAFTGVQANYCWSSTTYSASTTGAWGVNLSNGDVDDDSKTGTNYVWPVRGGQ